MSSSPTSTTEIGTATSSFPAFSRNWSGTGVLRVPPVGTIPYS
ncbi:hypothetical protein AB0J63_09950 [Streptosporangium canum]